MAKNFLSQLTLNLAGNFTKRIKSTKAIAKKSFRGIEKDFTKMQNRINRGQSKITKGFTTMLKGAAISAPILGMAIMASSVEKGLAEVGTLTDLTTRQINENFTDITQNAQKTFGQDSQSVIKSFYDSVSAGSVKITSDIKKSRKGLEEFLDISGKVATVGVTDMATSTDLLTTTMNSFNVSATKAGELLFRIVRRGKTTMPELGASFGQVASTASNLGVTLEETSAIIATLTAAGFKTPIAMTALRASITALAKPPANVRKVMERLNFVTDTTIIKNMGLVGTLRELKKRIDERTTSEDQARKVLANLLPNVRALGPILALTGKQSKTLTKNMDFMAGNSDILNNKFTEMSNIFDVRYKKALEGVTVAMVNFGKSALPLLTKIIEKTTPIVNSISEWISKNEALAGTLAEGFLGLSAFVTVIGGVGAAFGVVSMALAPLLVAGGLPLLIVLTVTLIALLPNMSKSLKEMGGVFSWIGNTIEFVVNNFLALLDIVKSFASGGLVAGFTNIATKAFNAISGSDEPAKKPFSSDALTGSSPNQSTKYFNENSVNIQTLSIGANVDSGDVREKVRLGIDDAQRLLLAGG